MNATERTMPIPATYTPDALQLPPSLTGLAATIPARAPGGIAVRCAPASTTTDAKPAWAVTCIAWRPIAGDGSEARRLGYADLLLPGGLILQQVNVVRTAAGLRIMAPHVSKRGPGAFRLATPDAWAAFSDAAVAAVQAFAPGALPNVTPATCNPPSASVARATMKD